VRITINIKDKGLIN